MYLTLEAAFERDQPEYRALAVPEGFPRVKTLTTHHAQLT